MRHPTVTLAERLIVAADFKPTPETGALGVRARVLQLSDVLADTGVCIKVNSALRACGYGLINDIHERGLRVFADLKLSDIGETMATDGALLAPYAPELLTVMCANGRSALQALANALPSTALLGVTVLTSLTEGDSVALFNRAVRDAVLHFCVGAEYAVRGFVCAPSEVAMLDGLYGRGYLLVTPNIRPAWSQVAGDDQNAKRAMTPSEAIRAGADCIVTGRPITQAADPRDAVLRTLDEIAGGLA